MKKYTLLFFLVIHVFCQEVPNEMRVNIIPHSPKDWDTLCYKSYKEKLNLYFGASTVRYVLDVRSLYKNPYTYPNGISFDSYTPTVYSFGFSYDKISAGLSIGKKYAYDSTQSKPRTNYRYYYFSFGGNKFIIEPYYSEFKGFHDAFSPKNDTSFSKTKRYYADPSLWVRSFKLNGIYFFNHKRFSYRSMTGYSYRQTKSKGSWLLMMNAYWTRTKTDSLLYHKKVEKAYDSIGKINGFTISGISFGGGYGYLWTPGKKKRFFIGFTVGYLLGMQARKFEFRDSAGVRDKKINANADVRFSIGWTTDKFFMVANGSADRVIVEYHKVRFTPYSVPFNLMIGFRFNARPPGFYQKFMATKVYGWM
jgi:hypothetical protein